MNQLTTGQFHGHTNQIVHLDGITLTDTEYTQSKVDWHYHKNAYFTFLLQGKVLEGNKKEIYQLTPGSLLFHHWQEPHYNIKPAGFTRGFHIEIDKNWFDKFELSARLIQGSINIDNPAIKILLYKIFKENRVGDPLAHLSIQSLVIETLATLSRSHGAAEIKKPGWVNTIRSILKEQGAQPLSLEYIAKALDIHPVHLSRSFSKYFHCTMGEYIRKIKVEKALRLLSDQKRSLTDISFECGFADQSHFTRCFKELIGVNPLKYRKVLFT